MKRITEDKLQQEIFIWFHNNYCRKNHKPSLIIHSTPNGGTRNIIEAKKLKYTGELSGVADLTIKGVSSRFVDVEVKLLNGKISQNQIDYKNKIIALNGNYLIVRSLKDFQEQIQPLITFLIND